MGGRGGEGRKGKGRGVEGNGHEPPHYLEEVYACGAPLPPNPGYATDRNITNTTLQYAALDISARALM